jgi:hypothetical protein
LNRLMYLGVNSGDVGRGCCGGAVTLRLVLTDGVSTNVPAVAEELRLPHGLLFYQQVR